MIFTDERRRRGTVLVTPAIQMTAAASGSNGITVADDDDIDFGTGDFFLHWEGALPDWTPASEQRLIRKSTGLVGYILNVLTTGFPVLYIGTGVGFRTYSAGASVGAANDQIAKVTVSVTRESASSNGSAVFYVNGSLLASVAITAGTAPDTSNSEIFYISGNNAVRTASNTISCIVGNFAPTAAEVLDLCTNGIPENWKWGSQTAVYTSDFSAGTNSFTANAGAVTGNIDGIGGEDNWLRFVLDSTLDTHYPRRASTSFTANTRFEISYKYYLPSGQSNVDGVALFIDNGSTIVGSINTVTDTATTVTAEVLVGNAVTDLRFYAYDGASAYFQDAGGNDLFYIKDVTVKKLGATMALLPNSIPTSDATEWDDSSGNTAGGTLPAAGATKVTIRR